MSTHRHYLITPHLLTPALLTAIGTILYLATAHAEPHNKTTPDNRNTAVDAKSGEIFPNNFLTLGFSLDRANMVSRYSVSCSSATFLDVSVTDQGGSGDHWQAKVSVWDPYPNSSVTTAPGPVGIYSPPARVYNYASTSGPLFAVIEVSYQHGINSFPASGTLSLLSDGNCTATYLGNTDKSHYLP